MVKRVVGLFETIEVIGEEKVEALAKFDTGADISSVDLYVAAKARLGPVIGRTKIRSAHGFSRRPVVKAKFKILGKIIEANVTLSDRKIRKHKVLVGKDVISNNFVIDPSREASK